jgi:hypothetical protein
VKNKDQYLAAAEEIFSVDEWKFLGNSLKFQIAVDASENTPRGCQELCSLALVLLEFKLGSDRPKPKA